MIVEPSLVHDSLLTGIQRAQGEDLLLFFTSEKGRNFALRLEGVEHFLCNEFREANIVFDVEVGEKESVNIDAVRKLLYLNENEDSAQLENYAKRIGEGDNILLTLTCSYGCEIFCLCKGFRIEEEL